MFEVTIGLLAVNTVFIILIFALVRRYHREWLDVATQAKAYYLLARTRDSRANRAVEEVTSITEKLPAVVESAIRESANGGSGIHA